MKVQWSSRQISTLRYIQKNGVSEQVRYGTNQLTLWSLAYAGAIDANGLTSKGLAVLEGFDRAENATRLHMADMTERTARILKLVRFRQMEK